MRARDDALPDDGRDETETERLDRNWGELLQELRVTQTGTQIITGFLLTVPFQSRFGDLDGYQLLVYLVVVGLALLATVFGLAPVNLHRLLFRQRAKKQIVEATDRLLRLTVLTIGLVVCGVALLVFDVVVGTVAGAEAGRVAGAVAAAVTAAITAAVWLALPVRARRRL